MIKVFYLTVFNKFMIITGAVQVKWVMPTFDQTKHEASPFAIPSVNFSNMFDLILAQLIKMQNLEFTLLNSDETRNRILKILSKLLVAGM